MKSFAFALFVALAGLSQSARAQVAVTDLHALISHSRTVKRTTKNEDATSRGLRGLLGNWAELSPPHGIPKGKVRRDPLGILGYFSGRYGVGASNLEARKSSVDLSGLLGHFSGRYGMGVEKRAMRESSDVEGLLGH